MRGSKIPHTSRTHVAMDRPAKRKFVCPDRTSGKRHADGLNADASLSCKTCLANNLVDVVKVGKYAEILLTSCCTGCGVLWISLNEPRKRHVDCAMRKRITTAAERRKQLSLSGGVDREDREMKEKAFALYFEDHKNLADGRVHTDYRKMDVRLQNKYLVIARARYARRSLYDGTSMAGPVDTRPIYDVYAEPHGTPYDRDRPWPEACDDSFDRFVTLVAEKTSPHVVFTTYIELTTEHWGLENYACYLCREKLDASYCEDGEPAHVKDGRVCSCAVYDGGETYPEMDTPPTWKDVAVVPPAGKDDGVPRLQHPVRFEDDLFLYQCNSMFSGFVVHSKCCSKYVLQIKRK